MALTVGTPAPNFKTTDQDGKQVSLSDLKGKKVVLYSWLHRRILQLAR
jgi:thioredoxin-dependent peroxiredoxin